MRHRVPAHSAEAKAVSRPRRAKKAARPQTVLELLRLRWNPPFGLDSEGAKGNPKTILGDQEEGSQKVGWAGKVKLIVMIIGECVSFCLASSIACVSRGCFIGNKPQKGNRSGWGQHAHVLCSAPVFVTFCYCLLFV